MRREYDQDCLKDYRTYRREMRQKFPMSKNHMDFEEFEFAWEREFSGEQDYSTTMKKECRQDRFA